MSEDFLATPVTCGPHLGITHDCTDRLAIVLFRRLSVFCRLHFFIYRFQCVFNPTLCVICMCTFCILCTSITRQSAHRQSPTDCIELKGVCVIGGSVSANTLALGQRHNLELTKGEGDSDENKKYKYPKHKSRCLKISHSQILRSHHPVQECKMQTPSANHHIG